MTSSLAVRFGGPPGRASSGQSGCDEPARSSSPSSSWPGARPRRPARSPTASAGTGLVDIGAGLQGPAGLTATVAATGLAHVSAFAFDADGRLWAATAGYEDDGSDAVYLVASDGRATGQGHRRSAHAARARLGRRHALRRVGGPGRRLPRVRRAARSRATDGPGAAVGRRRGQRPASVTGRPARPRASPRRATRARRRPRTTRPSCRSSPTVPTCASRRAGSARRSASRTYPATDDLFVTMNQRDDLGDGDARATGWPSSAPARTGGSRLATARAGAPATASRQPVAELDAHAAVSGVAIVTGQFGITVGHVGAGRRVGHGDGPAGRRSTGAGTSTVSATPVPDRADQPDARGRHARRRGPVGDWGTGTVYRIAAA